MEFSPEILYAPTSLPVQRALQRRAYRRCVIGSRLRPSKYPTAAGRLDGASGGRKSTPGQSDTNPITQPYRASKSYTKNASASRSSSATSPRMASGDQRMRQARYAHPLSRDLLEKRNAVETLHAEHGPVDPSDPWNAAPRELHAEPPQPPDSFSSIERSFRPGISNDAMDIAYA